MAMRIAHNNSAMLALGELKRNDKTLGKQLQKVSSGMKINSAGDGASEYSISERMRVRLRALNQNNQNVQTGKSLINVALGGVERQLDIMRTIKEKVIDANNDTNTDSDRDTIQKEINQSYDQLENIAYETTYNGKAVLAGTAIRDRIYAWDKQSVAKTVTDCAAMNVIADKYVMTGDAELVGDPAKYDLLSGVSRKTGETLGVSGTQNLSGGQNYKNQATSVTFGYTSAADLAGKTLTLTVNTTAGTTSTYSFLMKDSSDTDSYTNESSTRVVYFNQSGTLTAAYQALASAIRSASGMTTSVNSAGNGFMLNDTNSNQAWSGTFSTFTVSSGPTSSAVTHTDNSTTPPTTVTDSKAMSSLAFSATNTQNYQELKTATYTLNLSGYTNVETVIDDLTSDTTNHTDKGLKLSNGQLLEFYDSKNSSYELNTARKLAGSTMVDLNNVRTAVSGGATLAAALSQAIVSANSYTSLITDASGQATGVLVSATTAGDAGNNQTVAGYAGSLSSYDIKYGDWFASNNKGDSLAAYLNNKGFRVYADGSNSRWYNITFTDEVVEKQIGQRPSNHNTQTQTIDTLLVDVTNVTDAKSLVEAIQNQADIASVSNYRFSVDADNGLLTVYDTRTGNDGAYNNEKIADGPYDSVIVDTRHVLAEDVYIQDSDKGSQNLHLYVPKTSLDQIFEFIPGHVDVKKDYTVMTKAMRADLLGTDASPGIIDRAIEYLLDASTVLGAQNMRLQIDRNNIEIQSENVQASESTIRDADMAKEMTGFTKANVLAQSSQAMLAQANSNSSSVLSLLQG